MLARQEPLPSDVWRRRSSNAVLIAATLACIATSKKGWRLEAPLPARPKPVTGQAVQVVVDASRAPIVQCGDGRDDAGVLALDDRGSATAKPGHATYVCPPGVPLTAVSIAGTDGTGGGLCDGEREPPTGTAVTVADVRTAPVWTRAVDIPIHLTRDGVFLNLTTRYSYTITASLDADGRGLQLTSWPKRSLIFPPPGSVAPAHATVTLYGICSTAGCAPPTDAAVVGVEGQ
jgi:hypothetical protein